MIHENDLHRAVLDVATVATDSAVNKVMLAVNSGEVRKLPDDLPKLIEVVKASISFSTTGAIDVYHRLFEEYKRQPK